MNIEEIKIGETYNVRVKVVGFQTASSGNKFIRTVTLCEANDFEILAIRSKYDPCRLFRKGDKVRVVEQRNDRTPPLCGDIEAGEFYTVSDDEDGGDVMLAVNGKHDCIEWYWLELVTPVEELMPYTVGSTTDYFSVDNPDGDEISVYWKNTHPNAKEAAEAECARLNAEHRKEANNATR